jgi:hypothetical protein
MAGRHERLLPVSGEDHRVADRSQPEGDQRDEVLVVVGPRTTGRFRSIA